jgi:hypothetical protein
LWATEVADVKAAVLEGQGRQVLVWNPGTRIFAMPAIDALLARGRTCTTDVYGAISLTICTAAAP